MNNQIQADNVLGCHGSLDVHTRDSLSTVFRPEEVPHLASFGGSLGIESLRLVVNLNPIIS